eukprot:TRINITY_DN1537_c0_g1_i3.p1 TRINITY_DN1537_c0_g1~~TRINITY_DN1537_c0_g1_i3.p1  ORF type:complete len:531 (+),score=193.75 TRINITY_DN1537_c0_g1_i3:60-1595(+)
MSDVDMKDASAPVAPEHVPGPESSSLLLADLKKNLALVEKSVATKEPRFMYRALRHTTSLRRRLTANVLIRLVQSTFTDASALQAQKAALLDILGPSSDMDAEPSTPSSSSSSSSSSASSTPSDTSKVPTPTAQTPEVEVYVSLLVLLFLFDQKKPEQAANLASSLVDKVIAYNRATLNLLTAKVFFYYSFAHEQLGTLESVRPALLAAFRTVSLRHNDEGAATLLNLLLRNYLAQHLYDQADKLVSKTSLREQSCSSNQFARYLYYQGRIKAVQLDYSEAYRFLLQATRKAPQDQEVARGFRQTVHKFLCIVQLLLGEMPDIAIFRQGSLKRALQPYLGLVQAVRVGDLEAFRAVVERHGDTFRRDDTYTLILRLRHNVIKTGLRKINVSYSRISLQDIKAKLHLEGDQDDTEHIVAKAIKDGVIDATIDHKGGFVQSKEITDVYSSTEPHAAFHSRVRFCLDVHNDAVRAMRFPEDQNRRMTQEEMENARKERALQEELAKELDEEEDF